MQLAHVRVKHSRSLRNVSVSFGAQTALIGGNGAGKSSILKAIEKFYSTSKNLDIDDYFGRDTSIPIEIEVTFDSLSHIEKEAFHSRVRENRLVVTRIFDGTSSSGRYFGSVLQNPDFLSIRNHQTAAPKLAAYRTLSKENDSYKGVLPPVSSASAAEDALLNWENANPGALVLLQDDGQFFGFQNASRGALSRYTSFVFIPAVREAIADAADGKSSAIGKLLELVVRSAILKRHDVVNFRNDMAEKYQKLVSPENMPELGHLAGRLTKELKELYQDAEVGLAWRPVTEFPVPLPIADVALSDDGFGGPVDRQGHGLQRAFVFTLLQHLAKTSAANEYLPEERNAEDANQQIIPPQAPNLILAIEEPELYQHPTKQRHLATVLRGLSDGMLPGVESPTQIIFGSHSPMFVALDKADEIRLVRRTNCQDSNFKQCDLKSLDLNVVAEKLEHAHRKAAGVFNSATLIPRLHILGTELSEGFFAHGIVLVEGRSDKAMLYAAAKIVGRSFEAAGIAILSVEGKNNLDRPYAIFTELHIPTYILWDCDLDKNQKSSNLALIRLVRPDEDLQEGYAETKICGHYAHFENSLESLMKEELKNDFHASCLAEVCGRFGLAPCDDTHKVPEVMHQILLTAQQKGKSCPTLNALVDAIWQHLTNAHSNAKAELMTENLPLLLHK